MSLDVGPEYDGWTSTELSYAPSDATISAGVQKNVRMVNSRWGIYDQGTGNQEYETTLKNWWNTEIPDPSQAIVFDPKTLYDYREDRYVMIAIGKNSTAQRGYWLISASDDGDPNGTWVTARIDPPDNYWPDYPGLGIDEDGIYLTANMFDWSTNYQYSRIVIIDKSEFYGGGEFTVGGYGNLDGYTIQPAQTLTDTSAQYFINSKPVADGASTLKLWELTGATTSSPGLLVTNVDVNTYSAPPNANQPASEDLIDTGYGQLLNAVYEYGSLWTAHAVAYGWGDGDTEAIIVWYEIDPASRTIINQGAFGTDDNYFCFPTIMSKPGGGMVIVYNRIGDNVFPMIAAAGQPPGENTVQGFTTIHEGESEYDTETSTSDTHVERWGDYNGISLDADHLTDYWIYSQYASGPSNDYFNTWSAEVDWYPSGDKVS
jgi:hypothetical protein